MQKERNLGLRLGVTIDACIRMRRAIVDRHNIIDANSVIGYDAEADRGVTR